MAKSTRLRNGSPGLEVPEVLQENAHNALMGFPQVIETGDVGRHHGGGDIPQPVSGRQGLRVSDVHPGAGEMAPFQRVAQGLRIHDEAAAHV